MFLLAIITLSLWACSLEKGKQWYKPNDNYTVAEFERDQKACTKNRALDETCLRERGWVGITADDDKGPSPVRPEAPKAGGGRY
jgi:hypothetical protein